MPIRGSSSRDIPEINTEIANTPLIKFKKSIEMLAKATFSPRSGGSGHGSMASTPSGRTPIENMTPITPDSASGSYDARKNLNDFARSGRDLQSYVNRQTRLMTSDADHMNLTSPLTPEFQETYEPDQELKKSFRSMQINNGYAVDKSDAEYICDAFDNKTRLAMEGALIGINDILANKDFIIRLARGGKWLENEKVNGMKAHKPRHIATALKIGVELSKIYGNILEEAGNRVAVNYVCQSIYGIKETTTKLSEMKIEGHSLKSWGNNPSSKTGPFSPKSYSKLNNDRVADGFESVVQHLHEIKQQLEYLESLI